MLSSTRPAFEWMNDISRRFLAKDYVPEGQSGESRVGVIAQTVGGRFGRNDLADKIYDYAGRGWYSFSSPVWSNFGLDRGLPISCFGSYPDDSIEGILDAHFEIGMMSKHGGGTSICMTPIRHRGADIKDNGKSAGSVHFGTIYDTEIRIISQGSSRRGECAAYWRIDHPDIMEALDIRSEGHEIQKLSYGVCVPNYWMEELIAGDKKKREVWAKLATRRRERGYPYIIFIDNANDQKPQVYKDLGMEIHQSNLCVTGDQRVVSDRGLKKAKQLCEEGGSLTLFDNKTPVRASAMRLIEKDAEVYRVTLDNGMTHTVTAYHKLSVRTSRHPVLTEDRTCADLRIGDKVAIQTQKGVFGDRSMPQEAFLLGLYQGDGTQTEKLVAIDLWENDFDLADEVQASFADVCERHGLRVGTNSRIYAVPSFYECKTGTSTVRKRRLIGTALKKFGFQKGVIPDWIWEGDEQTQWQYVRGLLYTDGTVRIGRSVGNPIQINLASIDRNFLREVQLILANLGIQTTIRIIRSAGTTMLPDGRGGKKEYATKDCWRLIVGNKTDAITVERNTGFLSRKGVVIEDREYRDNTKKFYSVVSIEYVGKEDVYCCTVDTEAHHWVCNGVVTHNCTEIFLPNSPTESFVCCLSSMNMLRYEEWKDTDAVEVMVYLLDAVMSEFIDKAGNMRGFERAVRFAERHRALGMGQIGWHTYLQSEMIPFDSPAAVGMAVITSRNIQKKALAASAKMASELGEPLYMKGRGRRHTTLTAIAPTQSSAAIVGQVSEGIEIMGANFVVKDKQKVKYTYKNPILMELLASKGKGDAGVIDSIFEAAGSVQHLDFLSPEEKSVFRTSRETHPMATIRQVAARQPHVCQGQSMNLLIDPRMDMKEYNQMLISAWRMGVKSLYYQNNVSSAQELTSCAACQG